MYSNRWNTVLFFPVSVFILAADKATTRFSKKVNLIKASSSTHFENLTDFELLFQWRYKGLSQHHQINDVSNNYASLNTIQEEIVDMPRCNTLKMDHVAINALRIITLLPVNRMFGFFTIVITPTWIKMGFEDSNLENTTVKLTK